MKTNINGIETNGLTVQEFANAMQKKTGFNGFADGFKTSITKEEEEIKQTAEEIINELNLNPSSPSFFNDTRPIKSKGLFSPNDKYSDLGFEVSE